jgi:hypothetical protein
MSQARDERQEVDERRDNEIHVAQLPRKGRLSCDPRKAVTQAGHCVFTANRGVMDE